MNYLSKQIRSKMVYLIVCTLLIALLPGFSAQASAKTTHKYTGEEIYAGIALGKGEVAKLFPEIWDNKDVSTEDKKAINAAANKILSGIKKLDPQYFEQLEKAVYSNDVEKVNTLLAKGGELYKTVVEKDQKATNTQKIAGDVSGDCVTFALETAVGVVFVLVIAGVAVWFAPEDSSTQLSREMLSQDVVERIN
ncbi:sporulation delaying protein family toxin [Priestia megaterium]|uniref:sporulation delaying protein family toxin n=1 Tax=Priestia megaterium TaxID=1404 RepID=UPI0028773808|nr:sporulation delaying protein family toxin [Priestia megaterium]MBX4163799.1 sporulation delaying protein family toxin [Priestia megaterium]